MSGRLTLSYFEPQFNPLALMAPEQFTEIGAEQITEIASLGYNELVYCLTELDMKSGARLDLVRELRETAEDESNGMVVTADPWRVGGIFGGEGLSFHEQNGGKRCICDGELLDLLHSWVDTVAAVGIKRIFWDEPELECEKHNLSLEAIDHLSQYAVSMGIDWNASCIRSRDPNIDLSDEVASMVAIDEIAVAPYPNHPQNPTRKTPEEVVGHITPWFQRIKATADIHGISAQAWVQCFNIAPEDLGVIDVCVNEILAADIGNIAFWGYNGCASVPHLNPKPAHDTEVVWQKVSGLMVPLRTLLVAA